MRRLARTQSPARAILWDFDGTLAHRPGMWRGCLIETLDEHERGHAVSAQDLVPFLRNGFPWHTPEVAHPELGTPPSWWQRVEALLAFAYEQVGVAPARARELACLAHERYIDGRSGWVLFDDSRPVLTHLRERGWRHVVLSNHVPELEEIVVCLGLDDVLDAVVTSAISGFEKPHPEAFAAGRRAAGDADTMWMVGDSVEVDVAGAEAVGIPAILVRSERHSPRRAASLSEVIPLIESEPTPATSRSAQRR
jgi:putative hydrolase of the HAD superfamily